MKSQEIDQAKSTQHSRLHVGKVYLIGAGPGDPGLLTVRGADLLARADTVLYDGLVNDSVLRWARQEAQCICVGKHGHGGMWSQSEIDDQIVRFAKLGQTVVRLKGGDTSIFARTSEEVDRLAMEGIPFEVVPGITAMLAVSAYAGIPITHRDWSSAVALITGQLQQTDGALDVEESMDWQALAQFPGTLVLYMGVTTAEVWSQKLIAAGKPAKTPVAMIRRCTWPDQQVVHCDLSSVASTIKAIPNFRPPVISIVGEVVQLANTMDWFTSRPWFGRNVWVTSPNLGGKRLADLFAELGANALHSPVIDICPPSDWSTIDQQLRALHRYDVVVFSSVYGVDAFFDRIVATGLDGRVFGNAKIAAVGTKTAQAIARRSMHCDIVPEIAGAAQLADMLRPQCNGKRLLFVRNPDGETVAMDRLAAAGADVESIDVYNQTARTHLPDAIARWVHNGQLHAVTATSSNIADSALKMLGDNATQVQWLSLSPAISSFLSERECKNIATAIRPDFESLVGCRSREG